MTPELIGTLSKAQEIMGKFDWQKYGDLWEGVVNAGRFTTEGLESLVIVKPKEGKFNDSIKLMNEFALQFAAAGVTMGLEVYQTQDELMELLMGLVKQ
ncbi:MAG: hypothetical protein ACFFCS_28570 [Candidatus Hodarchaeota archaeon]